jgi:pyruvate formate lyase activating enzyme
MIPLRGHGLCKVRYNAKGTMELPYYGRISSVAVDPIEKKPLYHYYPGSALLSVGFVGCNFHCKFCQNWQISQTTQAQTRLIEPDDLVAMAREKGSSAIAYTFSEPLIHLEYLMDAARAARKAGLRNVLVSNGFITEQAGNDVLSVIDAANIDLKAWDPDFYKAETGGDLEEVKRFIRQAARKIHLEVTTLVIPGRNDNPAQIEGIARFLGSLDPGIPLHLSAYHPDYKYDVPPTPGSTIRDLVSIARGDLRYVYAGNLGSEACDTRCLKCGNILVHRIGYNVRMSGITKGACAKCGSPSPIVSGR